MKKIKCSNSTAVWELVEKLRAEKIKYSICCAPGSGFYVKILDK